MQEPENFFAGPPDIASSHGDQNISRTQIVPELGGQFLLIGNIVGALMTGFDDPVIEITAGEAGNDLFPGSIDIGEKQELGLGKNGKKFREQGLGTAVAMGLKGNDQAPAGNRPGLWL